MLWGVFGALLLLVVGIAVYGAVRESRRQQRLGGGGGGSGRFGFMSDHDRHRQHPFPPRASDQDGDGHALDTDDDGTVPNSPSAAHMADSPGRAPRGIGGAGVGGGNDDEDDDDDGSGGRRGAVAVVSSSATASAAAAAAARCGARGRGLWATAGGALQRLWGKRWFRRLVLLVRVAYLVADVALDVAVTVWLYSDGASSSSAVCLAFIVITQVRPASGMGGVGSAGGGRGLALTQDKTLGMCACGRRQAASAARLMGTVVPGSQAWPHSLTMLSCYILDLWISVCTSSLLQGVIGIALLASLSHHFFASRTLVLLLSPLLLVLMPVVGPVLAVANIRNSDVPLVFWR